MLASDSSVDYRRGIYDFPSILDLFVEMYDSNKILLRVIVALRTMYRPLCLPFSNQTMSTCVFALCVRLMFTFKCLKSTKKT